MGGFVEIELTFLDKEGNATQLKIGLGGYKHDVMLLSAYFEASKWVNLFFLHTIPFTEEEFEVVAKEVFSLEEKGESPNYLLDLVNRFTAGDFLSFIKHFGVTYYVEDSDRLLCRVLQEVRVVEFIGLCKT